MCTTEYFYTELLLKFFHHCSAENMLVCVDKKHEPQLLAHTVCVPLCVYTHYIHLADVIGWCNAEAGVRLCAGMQEVKS